MDDRETPLICMDFASMDTDGETTRDKAMAFATTLILVENKSGYPVAFSVETGLAMLTWRLLLASCWITLALASAGYVTTTTSASRPWRR